MDDLDWLINRYVDNIATPAEIEKLNELLRHDPIARRIFTEHLNLDSALAEAAAGLPGKVAAVEDIVQINQRALFSNAIAYSTAIVVTVLVLSFGAWFRMAGGTAETVDNDGNGGNGGNSGQSGSLVGEVRPAPAASTREADASVAVVIDEASARYASQRGPQGSRLVAGVYELISGVTHIRFAQGAEMILNGPARWTILDSMHVRVDYGKVRVIAPPSAKGFSVLTSDAEYIDLGTEFGLEVDQSRQASDLYVFDGQVNIADRESKQVMEEVQEGGSKRYRQGVPEQAPKMNSDDFPTPNQIGLMRWQSYVEELRHDSRLVAYFPFKKAADVSVLKNELSHPASRVSDGQIHGARWVSGRWPGKDSLLFDGDNEYVELNIPGEFQEYTITAWIKIDRLDYEMNAILNSNELQDGDVHFQITRQGLPKGGVQGAVAASTTNDTFIGDPLPIGRWVHVAMVISSVDRVRSVYANGKLVRQGSMTREVMIRPGMCRLGNWLPFDGQREKRVRAFRGRIDELAIWNQALPASQLRELVAAGRQNRTMDLQSVEPQRMDPM